MMEEICQLKIDKTKEKGSQNDPEDAVDKKETPAGGVPQHAEQRFITMAEKRSSQNKRGTGHLKRDSMLEDFRTY